ncbi:MAG: choice-of-anchor Q domain-containing protein, partial [Ilumatobacter sp.]
MKQRAVVGATGMIAVGGSLAIATPASAGDIPSRLPTEVSTLATGDDGTALVTLDEALDNAAGNPGPDTITFVDALFASPEDGLVAGSTTITIETVRTDGDVTIIGPGKDVLTIDVLDELRFIDVHSSSNSALQFNGGAVKLTDFTLDAGLGIENVRAVPNFVEPDPVDVVLERVAINTESFGVNFSQVDGSVTIADSEISGDDFGPGDPIGAFDSRSFYGDASVSINYAGPVLIEGTVVDGLGVVARSAASLTIDNSVITGSNDGAVQFSDIEAGVTISDSTIHDNSPSSFDGSIIGAMNNGGSCFDPCDLAAASPVGTSTLRIENSTITDNSVAPEGSIIDNTQSFCCFAGEVGSSGGRVEIVGSTIAGNIAPSFVECIDDCGAILFDSDRAVVRADSVYAAVSIITDNGEARPFSVQTQILIESTLDEPQGSFLEFVLLPEASAPEEDPKKFPEKEFPTFDEPTIFGQVDGIFGFGLLFDDDPELGDLGDNGGDTPTMLPAPDSPAVDIIDSEFFEEDEEDVTSALVEDVSETDQRGEDRGRGLGFDLGAVEVQPDVLTFSVPSTVAESDGTLTITLTRTGDGIGAAAVQVTTASAVVTTFTVDETVPVVDPATPGSDFTPLDEIVVFGDDDTADKTVTLTVATDDVIESNETVTVDFSILSNLELGGDEDSVTVTTTAATTATTTTTTTTPTTATPTTTEPTTAAAAAPETSSTAAEASRATA